MTDLRTAAKYALADLEGFMPELEPSGDRQHPGWKTIEDLRQALKPAPKSSGLKIEPKDFEFVAHCLRIAGHQFLADAQLWESLPSGDEIEVGLAKAHRDQLERCNSLIYAMEIHEEDEDDA